MNITVQDQSYWGYESFFVSLVVIGIKVNAQQKKVPVPGKKTYAKKVSDEYDYVHDLQGTSN